MVLLEMINTHPHCGAQMKFGIPLYLLCEFVILLVCLSALNHKPWYLCLHACGALILHMLGALQYYVWFVEYSKYLILLYYSVTIEAY
jgi:hypothetical protein